MCIDRGQAFVFHEKLACIYYNARGMDIAKGMDVSIERRCIKVAIIFNDRGICVEHSFEFSVSKLNTVTLKEW